MGRIRPAVKIILAPIMFRSLSDTYVRLGEADKEGRTVYIDPRGVAPHKTLYHELTHVRHPQWDEAKVEAWEDEKWGRMGWKQKAELLRMFGRAILRGEEE